MKALKNNIIIGNCVDIMKDIESKSIDVIFADPPYNLQLEKELYRPNNTKVNGVNEDWDKFSSFTEYDSFTSSWLTEAKRILKDEGTIWVMGSYHNIFRIGNIMQNLGFWILNDIIWHKSNPMPHFRGVRFNNAHENLIWAKVSENSKPYTFNYESMKIFNDDKQMQSVWKLPICNGFERLKENGKTLHPTQKPTSLLYRVILSSTKLGDTILDPFFGTGTTGVVAKSLGRNFVGIEINKKYADEAAKRIENTNVNTNIKELEGLSRKSYPRVSLGNLIENNLLKVGDIFFNKQKTIKSTLCADGSLLYKKQRYSIHKLASEICKSKTNGWNYWFCNYKNDFQSINEIRLHYLEKFK